MHQMTAAERQADLERFARRIFADTMLGIILAIEQADYWLARIMARP